MNRIFIAIITSFLAGIASVKAQWITQSVALKTGWNAVYLHVDPSHDSLENQVGADLANPILEIWMWAPAPSSLQFVNSPQQPVEGGQWMSWTRNAEGESLLQQLVGNTAYLVRSASNYTWAVKGKPLPPDYQWTTTGLNLIGFPTVPSTPPTFENLLSKAPELQQSAEIYHYPGGELSATNPARLYALRTATVKRGQAYWIRSGNVYNRYFAPFEVSLSGTRGMNFGETLNSSSLRLRNLAATNVTVTLKLVSSETPPAGQTNLAGTPPLVVRGALDTTNLLYSYEELPVNGTHTWNLAAKDLPGSDVEIVLGLDRNQMTNSVGSLFAGVLRLTDSFGHAQVDLPVTATVASQAGLWVGAATVTQVGHYLKSYSRDGEDNPRMNTNGQYIVSGINTNLGRVPRSYPLRLIVHNPEAGQGNATLLQRVFVGLDPWTNSVVSLSESSLGSTFLSQARRITATHLPWSATNIAWTFNGTLGQSSNLTATVTVDFSDQASNPFIHTYHPDHDNLDAGFKSQAAQGAESYSIQREITLEVIPSMAGADTYTTSGQHINGNYYETITLKGLSRAGGTNDTRVFRVRGMFSLNRISPVSTLTSQ